MGKQLFCNRISKKLGLSNLDFLDVDSVATVDTAVTMDQYGLGSLLSGYCSFWIVVLLDVAAVSPVETPEEDEAVLPIMDDDDVRPPLVPNGCLTMRMGGDKCCCFPCLLPRLLSSLLISSLLSSSSSLISSFQT